MVWPMVHLMEHHGAPWLTPWNSPHGHAQQQCQTWWKHVRTWDMYVCILLAYRVPRVSRDSHETNMVLHLGFISRQMLHETLRRLCSWEKYLLRILFCGLDFPKYSVECMMGETYQCAHCRWFFLFYLTKLNSNTFVSSSWNMSLTHKFGCQVTHKSWVAWLLVKSPAGRCLCVIMMIIVDHKERTNLEAHN